MTTLASHQTIASSAPAPRYGAALGGVSGRDMIAPPGKCKALIASKPGEGKSGFIQSHPGAFIFNLDMASTICPACPATIWPVISPDSGRALDDNGAPFVLTWEGVDAKIKVLKSLAAANAPRPETVVFDSLMPLISLLKDAQCRKAQKAWRELHGPSAWDDVYEAIVNTMLELANHGYGVIFTCHVMNAKIPLGEERFLVQPELVIGPSLYKRLFGYFEWAAEVHKIVEIEERPDPRFPDLKKTIRTPIVKAYLDVNNPAMREILKCRVSLPDPIEIPLGRGWATFTAAYEAAKSRPVAPAPTPTAA